MLTKTSSKLFVILFTGIALFICTSNTLPAQKKEASSTKTTTKQTKTTPKKSKVRVPPHFGKLNLTKKQRAKIYEIKTGYKSQIDILKKQLAELNKKQNTECVAVLTDSQKSILEKILSDAASKKVASKKTTKK